MKLTQLLKENEERPLSNEVKRHFLEIVSTYNKYQESMDRKSDITQVAETLGGITEAARTLAIKEAGDWFDKHTVKRNMSELDKLGKQFDKVALEARALDQRMGGLYEDMGHILSRYYKIGEISEEQMKQRLGIKEASEDCGCDSVNESVNEYDQWRNTRIQSKNIFRMLKQKYNNNIPKMEKGLETILKQNKTKKDQAEVVRQEFKKYFKIKESVKEQAVVVSKRTENGNIVSVVKEVTDLNEQETALYEFGKKFETLMEKNCPTDSGKWSSYKSQAKKKFDVYPSAYANGWAAKKYKAAGGGWKKC